MQTRVKSWEDLDFTRLNAATLRGLVEITLVEKMAGPRPAIFYCPNSMMFVHQIAERTVENRRYQIQAPPLKNKT